MHNRHKFRIGQTVEITVRDDDFEGKRGRIVQQHHARNVVEFPDMSRRDYLDFELKKA